MPSGYTRTTALGVTPPSAISWGLSEDSRRPAWRPTLPQRVHRLKPLIQRRQIRLAAQLIALVLVAWGVVHSSRQAAQQLAVQQRELLEQAERLQRESEQASSQPEQARLAAAAGRVRAQATQFWRASPVWLILAGLAYAAGMLPAGWYWRTCLLRLEQPAPPLRTMWAYMLGHLGKYFPGKAMVLVLRVGALAPLGVLKVATTATIFMETLTMMGVGGAAAALSLIGLRIDWKWTALALGLLAVTLIPILPPVLRQVLRRTQRGIDADKMDAWLSRIDWQLFAYGLGALSVTWLAYGGSLYCVLLASPAAEFATSDTTTVALSALAACALAVVLGFVSFLPGGAGVREVVLTTVLTPVVGPVAAIAAALWLRIVWLTTELVLVGLLWAVQRFITPATLPLPPHPNALAN
jgi:glycosyltransferase 2 family protein